MSRTTTNVTDGVTDRRAFLGRVTTGALITAATGFPTLALGAEQPSAPETSLAGTSAWDDSWLTRITGKHRQFFDAMTPNDGFALLFAANFLNMYNEVEKLPDSQLTAVVGIRHFATPMAFSDDIWKKYKLGEFFKITDPVTKAPSVRNIFTYDDGMMFPHASVQTLQKRGVIFTMCNVALTVLSGMTATAAGIPAEGAANEWKAGLLPGITLVPVGVMAVNRAQEHQCTYCNGG